MEINDKQKVSAKVLYPELSYILTGILFETHKELESYAREKQYCDFIEKRLKGLGLSYKRELQISNSGNILDFLIDEKIVLEVKSIRIITKDSYRQIQNYLQQTNMKLGILVNFREKFLKPLRIIRIDHE